MVLLDALKIAEEHLNSIRKTCPVEIDFNHDVTEEFPVGYVFYYNSKEYWETKDFSKSLAGNGPLFVIKETGDLIVLPSNQAVKRSLRMLGLFG